MYYLCMHIDVVISQYQKKYINVFKVDNEFLRLEKFKSFWDKKKQNKKQAMISSSEILSVWLKTYANTLREKAVSIVFVLLLFIIVA